MHDTRTAKNIQVTVALTRPCCSFKDSINPFINGIYSHRGTVLLWPSTWKTMKSLNNSTSVLAN